MRSMIITLIIGVLVISFTFPVFAGPSQAKATGTGSILGKVMKDTGGVPEDVTVAVSILNSSVPGDYFYANTTVDKDGNFIFINLPPGEYQVYAYGDHVTYGYSNKLSVSNDSTSTCAILVRPKPYRVNIHAEPISHSYSDVKTNITITVYDYYGDKIGSGWFITTHTNSGYTDKPYGYTDKNGTFTTILRSAPFEMYKDIKAFRLNNDGQYDAMDATYTEKFDNEKVSINPTATPTATPEPTPEATPLATPVGSPLPTPVVSTAPTPAASPGFGIMAGSIVFLSILAILNTINRRS